MSEITIAQPLSGEEIVDVVLDGIRIALYSDCHLNPAMAYQAFEGEIQIWLKVKDNGREPEIRQTIPVRGGVRGVLDDVAPVETVISIADRPPNVVRRGAGLPIPTLVEDSSGRKEVKNLKYGRMSAQGSQQDPGKQQQEPNPHRPGTPEHEKHEKDRKEREEREKKQGGQQEPRQ